MVKQLTRSAVRIYGALNALGNGSGDILRGLLPFLDPVLRKFDKAKLDPAVVAAEVRDTYKWNFNADLVEAFVPYLVEQGWLTADIPQTKDTSYTITMPENGKADASTRTVEQELRAVATKFKDYTDGLSPLTSISRDVEEFEDMLVEWLLYVEAFSEMSVDLKTGFRRDTQGTMKQFVEVPSTTSLRDEEKYLCASFVKHALVQDHNTSEVLARIASIGLLTEVVQDFVKPTSAVDRSDLVVYLDAPVAMELLGVSGKAAQENTAPVVEELMKIGATVRVFGQSVEEMQHSLNAVLKNPRPTGPTAQAMARGEVLREYVTDVSHNALSYLEKIGVRVAHRSLQDNTPEHQYFSQGDWQTLYAKLTYAIDKPHARQHDADIATLAIRQRRGKLHRDIFRSGAIVLTRNGLFAQLVLKTCNELDMLPGKSVAPVIHRRVLAMAMWLRTGLGAADLNIPKRMLLASCEQVLAIRPNVVEAVKRLTDALGDETKSRQLDLLISQDRSVQALMDKTLGASNVITEENLPLLWQEMLYPHLEEERQKGREAVGAAKAEGMKRLQTANDKLETLRREKDSQEASLNAKLDAVRSADREAIEALCGTTEAGLRRRMRGRILLGLSIGLGCSAPLLLDTSPSVKFVSFAIGSLFAYLTVTGGRLVGINIEERQALERLRFEAEQRRLTAKLNQFRVSWNGTAFALEELRHSPAMSERDDLFGGDGN